MFPDKRVCKFIPAVRREPQTKFMNGFVIQAASVQISQPVFPVMRFDQTVMEKVTRHLIDCKQAFP